MRMTTTKLVNSVISQEHVDDLLRNPQLNIQSTTSPATNAYSFHGEHREQEVHLKPAKYAAGAKPVRHLMILMNCIKIQYLSCSSDIQILEAGGSSYLKQLGLPNSAFYSQEMQTNCDRMHIYANQGHARMRGVLIRSDLYDSLTVCPPLQVMSTADLREMKLKKLAWRQMISISIQYIHMDQDKRDLKRKSADSQTNVDSTRR